MPNPKVDKKKKQKTFMNVDWFGLILESFMFIYSFIKIVIFVFGIFAHRIRCKLQIINYLLINNNYEFILQISKTGLYPHLSLRPIYIILC